MYATERQDAMISVRDVMGLHLDRETDAHD
jgi:hypothetical protein